MKPDDDDDAWVPIDYLAPLGCGSILIIVLLILLTVVMWGLLQWLKTP